MVVEAADGAGGAQLEALVTGLTGSIQADPAVQAVSPPRLNGNGDTALLSVVPRTGPADAETSDLVTRRINRWRTSSPRRSPHTIGEHPS